MKNLEELKQRLEAKKQENKERLSNLIESKKIELEITKLDSPYFEKQSLIQEDIDNLNAVTTMIQEKQAKHDKKLRRTFGLGELPSSIVTIASNVMYSKLEDREELMIASKLPLDLMETLVASIGRPAWFNPKEVQIEDEVPYDLAELKDSIKLAYIAMDLVSEPDLSKLTEENFERRFKAARLQAEELMANTIKYVNDEEVIVYN